MDIKLVIFDLDGVLVDTKDVHFNTLNDAIEYVAGKQYCITVEEHLHTYDGLKTNQKLELLTKYKLLDSKYHKDIWQRKQEATLVKFKNIITNNELIKIFNLIMD